ncbi:hypothetical protein [Rhodovulum bhavnagarense]|uniref:hypothetical protein n=1 Tax=Rhodovulum bhavnagarense TaxID=992286 RepID=UPI0010463028|nr:hypothetical protein [Rhodovulum bhavnagarense]
MPLELRGPTRLIVDQPWVQSCAGLDDAYRATGLPYGDSVAILRGIDRFVRHRLRYRPDAAGQDDWSSLARELLLGDDIVEGDCDDFALTAISLAICAGVAPGQLDFALVQSRPGTLSVHGMDHAIGIYTSSTGRRWIIGDTFGPMRPVDEETRIVMWFDMEELLMPAPLWRTMLSRAELD